MTFDEIMAPLGSRRSPATIWGSGRCRCKARDKFRAVMNWDELNRLLGMTTVWTEQTMMLILDNEAVAAGLRAAGRGPRRRRVMRPDPARVKPLLARGATMVLNFIDQLARALGLRAVAGGGARRHGQANLYLSSKRKQLQGALRLPRRVRDARHGREDLERVPGRAEHPIKHPSFEGWPRERHDQIKGELWRDVRLRPGDLLYLPRGQYHYALADDGPCVHVAWGVTYPIGMDVVSYAFERMVGEAIGRAEPARARRAPGAHRGDRADGGATSQRAPGSRTSPGRAPTSAGRGIATTCRT